MATVTPKRQSAFEELGLRGTVEALLEEIRELYLADSVPWVVGYSGGKDSTACLQLVWLALASLAPEQRNKKIHVISTDTLVENPVVAAWVTESLNSMKRCAEAVGMPVEPHRLTPDVTDTFWVNLIGKGYPAPRPRFRWCTERLKIKPANSFINSVVRESGEVILVLGLRKAESVARARAMGRIEQRRVRDRLSPNEKLPNSLVYSPVEDWTNDDIWLFLMQFRNPWAYDNKALLTMYQGASADGECPLVVDSSTPSCGDSRFGCWVCTLVEKDKSMQAMIQNDDEKQWMIPLLELRNELDIADDRHLRDFRRLNGLVQLMNKRPIPGPYTQTAREHWLRRLLGAQHWMRQNGPDYVKNIQLITMEELREIRRIWVVDKHEIEDNLPGIYVECMKEAYPDPPLDDGRMFDAADIQLLKTACSDDQLQFEMTRELLDIERRYRLMSRRAGLFDAIEVAIRRGYFSNSEDATAWAIAKQEDRDRIEKMRVDRFIPTPLATDSEPAEDQMPLPDLQ